MLIKMIRKIYKIGPKYLVPSPRYEKARHTLFVIRSLTTEEQDLRACKHLKISLKELDDLTHYETTVPHPEKYYLQILKAIDYYRIILKLL